MNVEVKEDGPCRRSLEIELDAEQVDGEYRDVLKQYARQVTIPGFRKGKAPEKVVEKKFSNEVSDETKKRLMSKAYRDAVKQEDLDVVTEVDIQDEEFNPESNFRFTVTVDVTPEFKLPEYKGIKLKGEETEPTEEDLEEGLQHVLEQYAGYEDIEDRPVQRDDMVKIDYDAEVDGQPLAEVSPENEGMGHKEDYWVLVNESAFLPEMQEALIGCSIGDEKDVEVRFGDDFADELLAGKKAVYHVKVKAIRGKKIPELDETIINKLGFETEEELRERLRSSMAESNASREKTRLQDEICEHLLKKTEIEVPRSEVQGMMEDAIKNIVRNRTRQGAQQEDIEKDKEEIFAEAEKVADERLKLRYILKEIADQEEVSVSDADVDDYMQKQAAQYGVPVDQVREKIMENSSMEQIKNSLLPSKTVDMLLEEADVKRK